MGRKHPLAVFLLSLLVIVASTAIFSDVYKWVDDDGIEHFGNKPPSQVDSTLVSTHHDDGGMGPQSDDTQQIIEQIDRALNSGDFEKAFQLLRPLAENGHPRAQNGMGVLFDGGLGVPQDLSEAAMWYQLSAEQGYAKAQFNLGVMYAQGEGVTRNAETAAQWYLRAAEQGHAFAQHNLASMYLSGQGVEQNLQVAMKWETAAAESGDPKAQYSLGLMYHYGQGVTADVSIAYEWISKALSNGYPITIELPSGWTVGYHARDTSNGGILELVRPGEDVNNWSELVTIQHMGPSWGHPTPQGTLEKLKKNREEACPGITTWQTIDSDTNSVTYEWQAYSCKGWPDQHEVAKIIYRPNSRVIVHYAAKKYQMPDQVRSSWIKRLASAS